MADFSGNIVPYHDPFDASTSEDFYNIFFPQSPSLESLSLSIPRLDGIFTDTNDEFDDKTTWDIQDWGSSKVGLSRIHGETSIQQGSEIDGHENMRPLYAENVGNVAVPDNDNNGNLTPGPDANYGNMGLPEIHAYGNMMPQKNHTFVNMENQNHENMMFSDDGNCGNCRPPENQSQENMRPPENQRYVDVRPLAIWPEPPLPYFCSFCMVLREIIHSNGRDTTKLEIHGRLGMICHAILEIRQNSRSVQHQMFDFCNKSIADVKEFLGRYCDERKQAGFFMLPDPLLFFYETLRVGLDSNWNQTPDVSSQPPPPPNSGAASATRQTRVRNDSDRMMSRTPLSIQRERTIKLKLKDLVQYFHLPIDEAAKKMDLCPTVLKKICRRDGLGRWPHRKIKSFERRIESWRPSLESIIPEERAHAQSEIQRLEEEMAAIFAAAA